MGFSLLYKLATKSMNSRKNLYFPYLLAVSILFAIVFISISLSSNSYLQENHNTLSQLLAMGTFFLGLISVIISFYTSRFVTQDQQKELGLYVVLGLERKHIRIILLIQNVISWLISTVFSILIGYGFGSILFAILTRMMEDTGATLIDYPFSMFAAGVIIVALLLLFVLIFLSESWKVRKLNVNELVSQSKAGESEPKSNVVLGLIGIGALIGGYFIALTTENVLEAFTNIFLAILLVIIATYCLFTAGSIILLKILKKNKKYYYQPNHFLSVSGMLYRMKTNAASLATIAILVTGIILTLTTTLTLYNGMESFLAANNAYEFQVDYVYGTEDDIEGAENRLQNVLDDFDETYNVSDSLLLHSIVTPGLLIENQKLEPVIYETNPDAGTLVYVQAMTIAEYNEFYKQDETLEDNQILITSNLLDLTDMDELTIGEETIDTKFINNDVISNNYGVEMLFIVVEDMEDLYIIGEQFPIASYNENDVASYEPAPMSLTMYFDIEGDEAEIDTTDFVSGIEDDYIVNITSRSENRHDIYQLFGGLLFIGMIMGIALIIGTSLLLYFKQISEGYADRDNYDIMTKVGLSQETIKTTINSQLFWVFGLPIIIAILHNIIAIKIMNTLLGLVAVANLQTYIYSLIIVIIVVAIFYIIFYRITSRVYYNIVHPE